MLTLGFSPCPNDTFIFHALVHGLCPGPTFAPPQLADVETLNRWALAGRLDVTKLSFHAYGLVQDRYQLLSAGSALGRGCGPLLVARQGQGRKEISRATIAIPGDYTTAALLMRLYGPPGMRFVTMEFSRIMAAVAAGEVDYGVIIHESRFTYQDQGLCCVQDLGIWWEEETGLPLPLGGIVARRELGEERLAAVAEAVAASVRYAMANPQASRDYIKEHAQEMADGVISSHVDLYVNPFSLELGEEGRAAIAELLRRGREKEIF
ncbi:MAG: 1,4-dihydroxy-6-naphthoate synthase [Thermodesulfobacteriota bacterium]